MRKSQLRRAVGTDGHQGDDYGPGQATRLPGKSVSADYFAVFGIKPLLGRTFLPDDDRPGASPVIVLSHATWQTRFGSDPGVLSRDLVIDDTPHQILASCPRAPSIETRWVSGSLSPSPPSSSRLASIGWRSWDG